MREGPLHSLIRLISGNQAARYGLLTLIGAIPAKQDARTWINGPRKPVPGKVK